MSTSPGATVEVGDLMFDSVKLGGADLPTMTNAATTHARAAMDLGLPASADPIAVDFTYHWQNHEGFTGISAAYTSASSLALRLIILWLVVCS